MTDPPAAAASSSSPARRRRPAIDLNEPPPPPPPPPRLPSPSPDARALVTRFHAHPAPSPLPAAAHPGEAGVGAAPPCAVCGRPEARGATVVCDACDRGFHVACAGYRPSRPHGSLEDWLCGECCASGTVTKRWKLGKGLLDMNVPPPRPRGLDMNLPPPTDADVDAGLELARTSKKCRLNNSLGASSKGFAGPFSRASMEQGRTALLSGKCTNVVMDLMKNGFEARQDNGLIISRGFEDPVFASSIGRHSLTNATVLGHVEGELLMQSLREFITERGGILGEGWHVEFKQSICQSDRFAFYCAPDGKKFESIYDVAHYLGVPSSFTYLDMNERVGGYDMRGSLPARRRKKYHAKIPITNGSLEKQDSTRSSCSVDLYSDTEALKPQYGDVRSSASVTKSCVDESGSLGFQDSIIDLPVQYEDFFVISLGKVDLQTSYKDKSQIRPVGYKSCWHDKVTGSLFECEVSNGDVSGPVFRVRRCSCSLLPIPNAVTFLVHNKTNKADVAVQKGTNSSHLVASCDSDAAADDDILMLLLDGNPSELDISSCFSRDYAETEDKQFVRMDAQKQGISTRDISCYPEKTIESLDMNSSLQDEIGEFYVEGRSSCSVWRMASQTLIDACREVYKQSGRLHFHCEHNSGVFSPKSDGINVEAVDLPCSLTKFSCASGPIDTPRVIKSDKELDVSCESIGKWIDQDRFGLDVDFVQEIIENLSGSHAFSRYQTLNDRKDLSASFTVGSGSLLAIQKTERGGERVAPYSLFRGPTRSSLQDSATKSIDSKPPQGRPLSSRLPAQLVGDVLQILEFLWRFSEVLGLKEPLFFEEIVEELIDPWPCGSEKEIQDYKDPTLHGIESLNGPEPLASEFDPVHGENKMTFVPVETAYSREVTEAISAAFTYGRCHGVILTKIHMSLLKVLIGELLCRVAIFVDPNVDARETKPRRGRKRDVDNSLLMKETKINMLINELSWPELARRYIVAVSSMNGFDSSEACNRNGVKVFRCLQGDGGVLCGSLSGVAAMEADALMLAEVERQISDPLKREYEVLPMDYKDSVATATCESAVDSSTCPPEWAQLLLPVRKLPTNVGTRIRKCVYEALAKNPPEWARKILEHSISKEVYKGNASGPTKKAVLSVLAEVSGGTLQPRPEKKPKQSSPISVPEAIMKRCHIVLRRAMLADVDKVFCNLLGTTLDNSIDSKDDTVICPPAMVSRPLDFRMIDYRLAVGAYAGSHEAFLEDVREVWHTLRKACVEKPNLLQLVEKLAQNFESLYQEEVLNLFQKFVNHPNTEHIDSEAQKELHDILMSSNEIPKAPWEDGVCKVCGIDKDDDSVLLCDTCDSEYHTYCLDPPLARIPKGNWYCSSCLASQNEKQSAVCHTQTLRPRSRRGLGVEVQAFQDSLNQLATRMEDREYWEFSTEERVLLLKFLCDEVLNSVLIHEHMDQCTTEKSNDLQQKLRSLSTDCKNLQVKSELLAMRTVQESANGSRDAMREVSGTLYADQEDRQRNGQNDVCENMDILLSNTLKKPDSGIKVQTFAAYGVTDTMTADCPTHTKNCVLLDKSLTSGSLLPLADFNKSAAEINELAVQSSQVSSEPIRDEACEVVQHFESKSSVETTDSPIKDRGSMLQNLDILQESYMSSGTRRTHLEQNTLPMPIVSGANMSAAGESVPQNQDAELKGNHYNVPFRMTETVASSAHEINSLNSEISQLQDSITTLQTQLMMTSFRRDFLGRDSFDRLYWVVGRPGKRPWLVVDGSISLSQKRKNTNEIKGHNSDSVLDLTCGNPVPEKNNFPSGSDAYAQVNACSSESLCHSSTWVFYESDYEIRELYNWLGDSDPRDRELKENILLWQKFGCHQYSSLISDVSGLPAKTSSTETSDCLATKAATILESKYGRWLELEVSEGPKRRGRKAKTNCEDRTYRCECLELVWPSRHHCLTCHQTFGTAIEFEGHNDGRCTSANHTFDETKVTDESLKGKGVRSESTKEKEHFDEWHNAETSKSSKLDSSSKLGTPRKKLSLYDIDEVSKKFITNNSNKDLVKEIGLIGSNGILSFIDSPIFYLDPPVLLNQSNSCNINPCIGYASSDEQMQLCAPEAGMGANTSLFDNVKETASVTMSVQSCLGNDTDGHLPNNKSSTPEYTAGGGKSYSNKIHGIHVCHNCTISESSFRPLVGKISQVLKRLKINLLDMEAALPEEALRPLKVHSLRRCAWRSYVKSAESIFEMVQTTILLESMIKTDYLKNGWWYWSSLTAAVKTPTVSSLALRIYSLDDCITYSKDSVTTSDPIESTMPANKTGKKRKDMECAS